MLAGLDELVLKCASETSRVHITEAIRCYEAGAYRAAVLTTYIAVSFDLIEKLQALASQGDGQAEELVDKLRSLRVRLDRDDQSALSGLLEFERKLLEEFRDKFEFLGQNEFEELSRLRSDRNRCAHPSFDKSSLPYTPSAELARLHIRNALVLVLTQEPRQGKAALAELRAVVLSKYFPEDSAAASTRLRATELANARDTLVRAFVDDIIFGVADKENKYFGNAAAMNALAAVIDIKRDLALPRSVVDVHKLFSSGDDQAVQFASVISIRIPEIAERLNDASKEVMRGWAAREGTTNLANLIRRGLGIDWLRETVLKRIPDLAPEHFAKLTAEAPPEILSRAAELYANVKSWDEANRVGPLCALPFVDRFTEDSLRLIFSAAADGRADLQGSHSFREFIEGLGNRNPLGKLGVNALLEEYGLGHHAVPDDGSDNQSAQGNSVV